MDENWNLVCLRQVKTIASNVEAGAVATIRVGRNLKYRLHVVSYL